MADQNVIAQIQEAVAEILENQFVQDEPMDEDVTRIRWSLDTQMYIMTFDVNKTSVGQWMVPPRHYQFVESIDLDISDPWLKTLSPPNYEIIVERMKWWIMYGNIDTDMLAASLMQILQTHVIASRTYSGQSPNSIVALKRLRPQELEIYLTWCEKWKIRGVGDALLREICPLSGNGLHMHSTSAFETFVYLAIFMRHPHACNWDNSTYNEISVTAAAIQSAFQHLRKTYMKSENLDMVCQQILKLIIEQSARTVEEIAQEAVDICDKQESCVTESEPAQGSTYLQLISADPDMPPALLVPVGSWESEKTQFLQYHPFYVMARPDVRGGISDWNTQLEYDAEYMGILSLSRYQNTDRTILRCTNFDMEPATMMPDDENRPFTASVDMTNQMWEHLKCTYQLRRLVFPTDNSDYPYIHYAAIALMLLKYAPSIEFINGDEFLIEIEEPKGCARCFVERLVPFVWNINEPLPEKFIYTGMCYICNEDFPEPSSGPVDVPIEIADLGCCKHMIHLDCMRLQVSASHLDNSNSCPACRNQIIFSEASEEKCNH